MIIIARSVFDSYDLSDRGGDYDIRHSGGCRCAIIGVPRCLRRLSLFCTFYYDQNQFVNFAVLFRSALQNQSQFARGVYSIALVKGEVVAESLGDADVRYRPRAVFLPSRGDNQGGAVQSHEGGPDHPEDEHMSRLFLDFSVRSVGAGT